VGWLVVVILTHYSWTSLLFFITATGQMLLWAFKKHRQYHEEFGNRYPRRRRAMFPMIA
jgi:very-long-chain enoyl-CoA reductase